MTRTVAIAMAVAVLGCKGRSAPGGESPPSSASPVVITPVAPPTELEKKSAEDLTITYLAAMGSKDCGALLKIVADYKAADCREDTEDWVEHQTQFIAVESVARDGRDKDALLVTTKMNVSGKDRPLVVRVQRHGDALMVHK